MFIAQKERERNEILGGLKDVGWWMSVILNWTVLYGLKPWRVLIPCVLMIVIGVFVFLKEDYMKLREPNKPHPGYNCIWYSFDLFIPFVDLKAASFWIPDRTRKRAGLRKLYMRIHIFFGWILIPISLLSLTGIFK